MYYGAPQKEAEDYVLKMQKEHVKGEDENRDDGRDAAGKGNRKT